MKNYCIDAELLHRSIADYSVSDCWQFNTVVHFVGNAIHYIVATSPQRLVEPL